MTEPIGQEPTPDFQPEPYVGQHTVYLEDGYRVNLTADSDGNLTVELVDRNGDVVASAPRTGTTHAAPEETPEETPENPAEVPSEDSPEKPRMI